MSGARLKIGFAGPLVSVQDGGRMGRMRFGVPESGAMDRLALAAANTALGNPPGAAGIEVSRGGLTLSCSEGAVTLAIAGGGFIVEAAGGPLGSWHVLTLRQGERLVIRPGPWGSWCYVAFAGALRIGAWLGSASTHALSGLGGGVIRTGQELEIAEAQIRPVLEGPIPCPVIARPRHTARVVLGPQDRFFGAEAVEAFLSARYTLSDAYDRMGVRLSGPALVPESALGIPSEAILRGSVQVAGDGVPVVLLADHQTTGGYPKIATVVDADLDGFAQLRPRDAVRFSAIPPAEAVALARHRARARQDYLAALGRATARRGG